MLESLERNSFSPHVGEPFQLEIEAGQEVELVLREVKSLGSPPRPGEEPKTKGRLSREPFSLLFHGPKDPSFPQRTYRIRHPVMGEIHVFLVPVGPDEDGLCYEAIFN